LQRRGRWALVAAALTALLQINGCSGRGGPTSAARARVSPTPTPVPPTPVPATPTPVPDIFASVIRPIIRAHCSPCHEPGGRMYGRLPFDDPKVLSSHSDGVLRRLKGDNREAFERWIATLNPEEPKR
jgi:hypothetical protein